MPQTPPELPPSSPFDVANRETVRLVLQLNDAICAFRAGEASGVPALDSASGPMIELTDEEVLSEAAHRTAHRHILQRPDRVELAILTALADTYGAQILTHAALGYALRLVAQYGGVVFAQRIVWGSRPLTGNWGDVDPGPGGLRAHRARIPCCLPCRSQSGDCRESFTVAAAICRTELNTRL